MALGSFAGWAVPLLLREAAPGPTGIFSSGFSRWSQVPAAILGYEANSDVSGRCLSVFHCLTHPAGWLVMPSKSELFRCLNNLDAKFLNLYL